MAPHGWRRFLAPAAFLLAATIAVVLIRSGLEAGSSPAPTSATTTKRPPHRFWVVHAGDTFAIISRRTHVSVARIRKLNPRIHSASLFIGQKIRIE